MNEEALWASFNDLAQELVLCAFALRADERKDKLLQLHLVAARIEPLVRDREDEYMLVCRMEGLIYRANSAVSAAEQCENIRQKTDRHCGHLTY